MFSPPKMKTIVGSLVTLLGVTSLSSAQDAEYQRRMAAMQNARQRAQMARPSDSQVRLASAESGFEYAAPPAPTAERSMRTASNRQAAAPQRQRTAQSATSMPQRIPKSNQSVRRTSGLGRGPGGYVPNHVRTAQLVNESVVDGGSPIVSGTPVPAPAPAVMAPAPGAYETVIDGGYMEGTVVDGGYVEGGYVDGGCGDCGSCVDCCGSSSFFDCGDGCCGRGGCPPGPCWLSGLGGILGNGSYFAGAVGFENPHFQIPGTNDFIQDSNFGYHAGFNLGWPLCRLTCGLLSGQIGFRSVQTSFNGNDFTTVTRDQNFITFGLYRRVDYGIQAGLVVDYLNERWYAENKTAQIRGDLGWAYPDGSAFGFRFGVNTRDEFRTNVIGGNDVELRTFTQEWYKFYFRRENMQTGLGELFGGWTNNRQAILGCEFDVPVAERFALQANYTYYLNGDRTEEFDSQLGGNLGDAWNIAVGLVFRPAGRCYYRSYDRPMFDVADNGSMMVDRGTVEVEPVEAE